MGIAALVLGILALAGAGVTGFLILADKAVLPSWAPLGAALLGMAGLFLGNSGRKQACPLSRAGIWVSALGALAGAVVFVLCHVHIHDLIQDDKTHQERERTEQKLESNDSKSTNS